MTTHKALFLTAAAALFAAAGYAQNAKEPNTVRDYCYKAFPGKAEEFLALSHNTMLPLEQAAADAGEFAWKLHAVAVVPAGESAPLRFPRCRGLPRLVSRPSFKRKVRGGDKARGNRHELGRATRADSEACRSAFRTDADQFCGSSSES